jgi:hypothetical protein
LRAFDVGKGDVARFLVSAHNACSVGVFEMSDPDVVCWSKKRGVSTVPLPLAHNRSGESVASGGTEVVAEDFDHHLAGKFGEFFLSRRFWLVFHVVAPTNPSPSAAWLSSVA